LFIGSKGKLYSPSNYGSKQVLWPEAQYKDFKDPEPTLPRIKGGHDEDENQKREWVEAIRAGKPSIALSNFEYASTLTESMLLGNVAVRSGEAIDYEPATGRITNGSTASQYLSKRPAIPFVQCVAGNGPAYPGVGLDLHLHGG